MQFLDSSRHLFRVWRASLRTSLIREMEFRGNFIAGVIRQMAWLAGFIFLIEVIFANTQELAGWDKSGVLVILSLSRIIEGGINSFFASNLMKLPALVQTGEFDLKLSKPLPSQWQIAFMPPSLDNVGGILGGIGVLVYAYSLPTLSFSWTALLASVALGVLGMAIYYGLLIIIASLVFRLERLETLWSFNTLLSEPLTVPFEVFPRAPRVALTYFIPLAFIVFVPAQALTSRLTTTTVVSGIIITGVVLILANLAWRTGLSRYSSASS